MRWLVLLVVLSAIGGFYAFGLQEYFSLQYLHENLDAFKLWVNEHFLLALIGFFCLYVVLAAVSFPGAWVLTLLAGAIFDIWIGIAVALVAATLGATLAFWSSRFVLRDWVQERFGTRLAVINRGVERDGAYYLFSLRLVPLFPFFVINLAMGLTPMRTWTFFWVSLIGMLPGCLLYINVGRTLAELQSTRDLVSPGFIISLTLFGIAPLVFRKGLQWGNDRR
ncbi:MAG: TVP38/TMEM64 family protein [Gemmataceae bacterium]|nr:TVP38/TMEM64 family protein [Gemmataceae bacterium]